MGDGVKTRVLLALDHPEEEYREAAESYYLGIDDTLLGHTHDGFGHAFPMSRQDLLLLRHQITVLLVGGH